MKKILSVVIGLLLASSTFAHEGVHKADGQRTVKVEISEDGFHPAKIKVNKGEGLILLVTRITDKTCIKELKSLDNLSQVTLPLNKEVEIKLGKLNKSGHIKLLCGMDMAAGIVTVI